jgi:hypothetical protein
MHVIARKLERITRTRIAARSVRVRSLVRLLCCRSVLGLGVVQNISDVVYRMSVLAGELQRERVSSKKNASALTQSKGFSILSTLGFSVLSTLGFSVLSTLGFNILSTLGFSILSTLGFTVLSTHIST